MDASDPDTLRAHPTAEELHAALAAGGERPPTWATVERELERAGLDTDDPRLLQARAAARRLAGEAPAPRDVPLDARAFSAVVGPSVALIDSAVRGALAIGDFASFRDELGRIHEHAAGHRGGTVAAYIPQLARVDPDLHATAFCSVDGQRARFGDTATTFCLQSICKPVNYCIALEERGEDVVHRHVGWEPSGHSFNALTLDDEDRPHNPMINAGAIMCCSLIRPQEQAADRFDHVTKTWRRTLGGRRVGFSNAVYLSERQTADRNFALGYFMREKRAFEPGADLIESLEFYFQCCSIESTADDLALAAATLATGGVCPLTGERVFRAGTVQRCLSLMLSCGMYDYSGAWAFHVGIPAKSGVSGVIVGVVPKLGGFCTFSPRLDEHGNSVRGIAFFTELVRTYDFHVFDHLADDRDGKIDPRRPRHEHERLSIAELCDAARQGDLTDLRRLLARGRRLDAADYDGRTPLHLAAAEGHADVVEFLLSHGVPAAPVDRFGNTPADDAARGRHEAVAARLRAAAAT